MSVRNFALALFIPILFLVSACSLPSLSGPTATPAPTNTPVPISIDDPTFLAGLWRGDYDGAEVVMTFDLEGNIGITAYSQLQSGTYTINLSTKPYQMDIQLTDVGTITTIIEFVDSNTIRIENVYPFDPRPSEFFDFFLLTRSYQ
jgi:hypothetical protein